MFALPTRAVIHVWLFWLLTELVSGNINSGYLWTYCLMSAGTSCSWAACYTYFTTQRCIVAGCGYCFNISSFDINHNQMRLTGEWDSWAVIVSIVFYMYAMFFNVWLFIDIVINHRILVIDCLKYVIFGITVKRLLFFVVTCVSLACTSITCDEQCVLLDSSPCILLYHHASQLFALQLLV